MPSDIPGRREASMKTVPTLTELMTYSPFLDAPRWKFVAMALYLPLGVALVVVRVVTTFVVTLFLFAAPASYASAAGTVALNVLWVVFGGVLRVRCADGGTPAEARSRLRSARVIVSNHLSQADSWPFRVLTPIACVIRETYLGTSRWLPVAKLTTAAFDPIYVPTPGSRGEAEERAARAATKAAVERHVRDAASKPLLYFPEGSITNGRGLMRFSAFVFGLDVPVTPVAVSFWEPWPLALDTVWSPLHWNLLRMAYQPCHVVELAVLPTLAARAGEEPPAFAERTATDLANELGIAATPHTTEEKRAAMKKLKKAGQAKVLREGPEAVLRAA